MSTYKLAQDGVIKDDGIFIPEDEKNRDWREYLEWVGEGNSAVDDLFEEARTRKNSEINQKRANALDSLTVTFNSNVFDADITSRKNLNDVVTAIQAGASIPANINWRTADNNSVLLSHADFTTLCGLMFNEVNTQYTHSWALKAQLDAATNITEVNAITW